MIQDIQKDLCDAFRYYQLVSSAPCKEFRPHLDMHLYFKNYFPSKLQICEIVNCMKDLIDHSQGTKKGPIGTLGMFSSFSCNIDYVEIRMISFLSLIRVLQACVYLCEQ